MKGSDLYAKKSLFNYYNMFYFIVDIFSSL